MSLQEELRRTADELVLTACVIAEKYDADAKTVALTALTDAVARQNERGALGSVESAVSAGTLDWSDES